MFRSFNFEETSHYEATFHHETLFTTNGSDRFPKPANTIP
jgi:hypothetical protein